MDTLDMLNYILNNKKKPDNSKSNDKKNKKKDHDDWDICPYCGEYVEECTCGHCECDDFR